MANSKICTRCHRICPFSSFVSTASKSRKKLLITCIQCRGRKNKKRQRRDSGADTLPKSTRTIVTDNDPSVSSSINTTHNHSNVLDPIPVNEELITNPVPSFKSTKVGRNVRTASKIESEHSSDDEASTKGGDVSSHISEEIDDHRKVCKFLRSEVLDKARRFKVYHTKYEALYRELTGREDWEVRDREKEKDLLEMHRRLSAMKEDILSTRCSCVGEDPFKADVENAVTQASREQTIADQDNEEAGFADLSPASLDNAETVLRSSSDIE